MNLFRIIDENQNSLLIERYSISQTTLQKYQDKLLECRNTTNELNSFNQVMFFSPN